MRIAYFGWEFGEKSKEVLHKSLNGNGYTGIDIEQTPDASFDYFLSKSTGDPYEENRPKVLLRNRIFEQWPREKIIVMEMPFFPKMRGSCRLVMSGLMRTDTRYIEKPNYGKLIYFMNLYKRVEDHEKRKFVGIPLQIPSDKSLMGLGEPRAQKYLDFVIENINRLYETTKYPIILKFHPKLKEDRKDFVTELFDRVDKTRFAIYKEKDLDGFFGLCKFTFSYTSNTSVESYMCGVPTFVHSKDSWAWPLSVNAGLSVSEQKKWLAILAANQYHFSEFESGQPFHDLLA